MNPPKVIRVTADHIARGERKNGGACPIALAIREQWGNPLSDIQVELDDITVYPGPAVQWLSTEPPPEAEEFIARFDDDRPVEPFEFAVEWIDQDGVGV